MGRMKELRRKRSWLRPLLAVLMVLLVACGCAGCGMLYANYTVENEKVTREEAVTQQEQAGSTGTGSRQQEQADSAGTSSRQQETDEKREPDAKNADGDAALVEEAGEYTSKEEVAAYLHLFGHLPDNFITKKEAKKLGWVSSEGNLWEVAPGKSIGGDYFGNYEGLLPEKNGREYHECDIDSDGSYRGAKRIIFSDDGLIYYTEDHYESFELLYGEE